MFQGPGRRERSKLMSEPGCDFWHTTPSASRMYAYVGCRLGTGEIPCLRASAQVILWAGGIVRHMARTGLPPCAISALRLSATLAADAFTESCARWA